jgi:hypothetical protein
MHRISGLTLIVLFAISNVTILGAASAQFVSKPPVPEFTTKYVDHSYDIPPTHGTDQYTGNTVITREGQHINNRTVEITITNQPFTPFNDSNGNVINRFYDVRYKGAYTDKWSTMFANTTQVSGIDYANPYTKYGYAIQDYSAQYTTISYQVAPTSGQIDFQVEALEGYTYLASYDGHLFYSYANFAFCGQESGWSNTQTVTIGATISSSPNPTPTQLPPTSTPYAEPPTNSNPCLTNNPTSLSANGNQLQLPDSIPLATFTAVVIALIAIIPALTILLLRRHRKAH